MAKVVEKKGKYYGIHPSSKNLSELNKDEIRKYLLSKERLNENDKMFLANSPQMDVNKKAFSQVGNLSSEDLAKQAQNVEYFGYGRGRGYRNTSEGMLDEQLYQKLVEQEAFDRGAVSVEGGIGNPPKPLIDIPPQQPMTDDEYFQTSSDINQLYPQASTPEQVSSFARFTADQSLKTQNMLNKYRGGEIGVGRITDTTDLQNKLSSIDSTFSNIKPEFLDTLQTVANSDRNFTGFKGAEDVIDAVGDMVANDKPLSGSNFPESLEILDNMIMGNLRNMGNVLDVIGVNKAVNEVVRPITSQMKKFAGQIGKTIGNIPENIASVVARQDPVTNEIPGGIVGSEAYNAGMPDTGSYTPSEIGRLGEGFEETFQKTYGDMPELEELKNIHNTIEKRYWLKENEK